ncbi:hypothetical protein FDW96_16450 [Citrobacter sp. TBCS-15]|nr:hypothetical protein FDW96_16450 [Citrobacter sp. TBCS-15]TKU53292.1 hypothetical protein FDX11_00045 [Citrobacter sp. wls714]
MKMNWCPASKDRAARTPDIGYDRNLVSSQPLVIFIILVRIIYLSGKKIADKVCFTSDFLV